MNTKLLLLLCLCTINIYHMNYSMNRDKEQQSALEKVFAAVAQNTAQPLTDNVIKDFYKKTLENNLPQEVSQVFTPYFTKNFDALKQAFEKQHPNLTVQDLYQQDQSFFTLTRTVQMGPFLTFVHKQFEHDTQVQKITTNAKLTHTQRRLQEKLNERQAQQSIPSSSKPTDPDQGKNAEAAEQELLKKAQDESDAQKGRAKQNRIKRDRQKAFAQRKAKEEALALQKVNQEAQRKAEEEKKKKEQSDRDRQIALNRKQSKKEEAERKQAEAAAQKTKKQRLRQEKKEREDRVIRLFETLTLGLLSKQKEQNQQTALQEHEHNQKQAWWHAITANLTLHNRKKQIQETYCQHQTQLRQDGAWARLSNWGHRIVQIVTNNSLQAMKDDPKRNNCLLKRENKKLKHQLEQDTATPTEYNQSAVAAGENQTQQHQAPYRSQEIRQLEQQVQQLGPHVVPPLATLEEVDYAQQTGWYSDGSPMYPNNPELYQFDPSMYPVEYFQPYLCPDCAMPPPSYQDHMHMSGIYQSPTIEGHPTNSPTSTQTGTMTTYQHDPYARTD